jgi:hypothetical protein
VNWEEGNTSLQVDICEKMKDLLEDSVFNKCFLLGELNATIDVVAILGWAYLAIRAIVKSTCSSIIGDKPLPLRSCLQRFLSSDWMVLMATLPSVAVCITDLCETSLSPLMLCVLGGIPAVFVGTQLLFDCWKITKCLGKMCCSACFKWCPACLSDNCCLKFLKNSFNHCDDRWKKTALYRWWRDEEIKRLGESIAEMGKDLDSVTEERNRLVGLKGEADL